MGIFVERNDIARLAQSPVEEAITLCQLGDLLLRGNESKGQDKWSVNLHVGCPQGGKPIGISHTHPGGEPVPSDQDIVEVKRLGLSALCVSVPEKNITKCYRVE